MKIICHSETIHGQGLRSIVGQDIEWVCNVQYVWACAFVLANTNRWQHKPPTQADNNKRVREDRFPTAGSGCAQTWGFAQSCDPALLLLSSYVIPM